MAEKKYVYVNETNVDKVVETPGGVSVTLRPIKDFPDCVAGVWFERFVADPNHKCVRGLTKVPMKPEWKPKANFGDPKVNSVAHKLSNDDKFRDKVEKRMEETAVAAETKAEAPVPAVEPKVEKKGK
jgi:hypothetical protein